MICVRSAQQVLSFVIPQLTTGGMYVCLHHVGVALIFVHSVFNILYNGMKEGRRKEGESVLAAKDETLLEMTPLCGSQAGKPVHDPHFG